MTRKEILEKNPELEQMEKDGSIDIGLIEQISDEEYEEMAKKSFIEFTKNNLNIQRDQELKGFIFDNIFLNKEIIKDMAVKFTTMADDEIAKWIDINNQKVELTKAELGILVKKGTQTVEDIYFKYRALKDKLEK
jgi:hypothetical protein